MKTLREYRVAAGLTYRDLGSKAGVSASTVHRVENGLVLPSIPTLVNISAALDVDPLEVKELADSLGTLVEVEAS